MLIYWLPLGIFYNTVCVYAVLFVYSGVFSKQMKVLSLFATSLGPLIHEEKWAAWSSGNKIEAELKLHWESSFSVSIWYWSAAKLRGKS